ncbi:MAG: hypothetical protein ABI658_28130 [Acidimicrobiales bacterium]
MTELQSPHRKSHKAKAIFGLLLAVVMVGAFANAASASNTNTPRRGELHVTKECSQYTGNAGGFCTILGSNLNAIDSGMKVIYTSAPVFPCLCTDLVLDGPGKNDAFGHVTLDLQTFTGTLTFSGGTGRFSGFHANVAVTVTADNVWHWDGTYSFTPPGHDKKDRCP